MFECAAPAAGGDVVVGGLMHLVGASSGTGFIARFGPSLDPVWMLTLGTVNGDVQALEPAADGGWDFLYAYGTTLSSYTAVAHANAEGGLTGVSSSLVASLEGSLTAVTPFPDGSRLVSAYLHEGDPRTLVPVLRMLDAAGAEITARSSAWK